MCNRLSVASIRILAFAISLLLSTCVLAPMAGAQTPASSLVADPNDKRFVDVTEDLSTPALTTSHLKSVRPLFMVDDTHAGYTVETIHLQWRWADPLDIYLITPKGVKKPPVILNLYGYPSGEAPYQKEIFQEALIKEGFAAVGIVSALTGHRYHDRPMKEWFLSELQESLATSAHDVQMIMNYLTARGDLDMNRVGMFGQGSGATIAILASAVDPRIKVLDVLDPWGDWPTWIATSPFVPEDERADYMKTEFLKKAATLETLDWLPKIQAKKFRLQQNMFELDTPTAVKAKLRAAAPPGTGFASYQAMPEFLAVFGKVSTNLDWVKRELKMLPERETAPDTVVSEHR